MSIINEQPVELEVDKVYKVLVKKELNMQGVFTNLSPHLWISKDETVDIYGSSDNVLPTLYTAMDLPASGSNTEVNGTQHFPKDTGILPIYIAIKPNSGTPAKILGYGFEAIEEGSVS